MGRGGHAKLSKNKRTETQKQRRSQQPLRTEANRKRKRLKHLRKYPNDAQTATLM